MVKENLENEDKEFEEDINLDDTDVDSTIKSMIDELEELPDEEVMEEEEKTKEKAAEEPAEEVEGNEEKEKEEKVEKVENEPIKKIKEFIKSDTTLKSKGLEAKVGDFTPEELTALLQKGLRFYQAMEENSKRAEELAAKEKMLEDALKLAQHQKGGLSETQKETLAQKAGEIPDESLEITDFDDEATKVLKNSLKQLKTQVADLTAAQVQKEVEKQSAALMQEIEKHKEDYPLANIEEVLAVHFLTGGQVPIQKVMEASQKYYGSVDFVKRIFTSNPEIKQEVMGELIKEYLAKQSKAKKTTPVSKTSGETKKVIVSAPEKATITLDNASEYAKKLYRDYIEKSKLEE
jgi:hypothetical protein